MELNIYFKRKYSKLFDRDVSCFVYAKGDSRVTTIEASDFPEFS